MFGTKNRNLIGGQFKIVEVTDKGGIDFPAARAKYGDRMTNNAQTDTVLNTTIWNAHKEALNEARPFYTRTFTAFSQAPLGDLERDGGKIFITEGNLRFGGFTEADLKQANIQMNKSGIFLVIDQKYDLKNEGDNSYSVIITPELIKLVDVFYNVKYEDGWREVEPKHLLPIGKEIDGNNADARYLYTVNKIGPVRRGNGYVFYCDQRFVGVGDGLDDRRGVLVQAGPDVLELVKAAEKELGANANGPATQAFLAAVREQQA